MSGYTIYNNTFIDVQTGLMLGGGRRNHIKYNHFVNCTTGIEFDSRGTGYTGKANFGDWGTILQSLHDPCCPNNWVPGNPGVPPKPPQTTSGCCPNVRKGMPWSIRYPDLVTVLEDHPGLPCYNEVMYNTWSGVGKNIPMSPEQATKFYSLISNNTEV